MKLRSIRTTVIWAARHELLITTHLDSEEVLDLAQPDVHPAPRREARPAHTASHTMPQTSIHGLTQQMAGPSHSCPSTHMTDGLMNFMRRPRRKAPMAISMICSTQPASTRTKGGQSAHAQQGPYY